MLRVAKGMDEKVGHSGQCCFGRCEFGGAACTVPPKIENVGKGFHPLEPRHGVHPSGLSSVRYAQPLMLQQSHGDLDYVKFIPL